MHGNASTPLLDARQLSKSYGERSLFHIDELELHRGEATLLTGRNGAGKSTLLKVLAGLEPQHGGQLRYCGTPLTQRRHRQLGGKVIYLHQHPYLFDTCVANNIGYGLKHLSVSQRQQAIDKALDWSGLSHLRERRAKTLSGGEKQRIALARAWVMKPELLLLDEPTANMDAEAREQTLFLIRRLINDGVAVVLCSHELKVDKRLIRRQLHLEDGVLYDRSNAASFDTPPQHTSSYDIPDDPNSPAPLMQLTEA